MKKLFDLRFVIGAFFTLIGLVLLVFSMVTAAVAIQEVNRWCGLVFLAFGLFMILLSLQKDAGDDLLEGKK